jgi:forkhead transcription factor HCM1
MMDNSHIPIFQDAFASAPMISHAPMPSAPKQQPPPPTPQQQQQQQQQPQPQQHRPQPLQAHDTNMLLGAPPLSSPQHYGQISPVIPMTPTDSMVKKPTYMTQFKNVMAMPYSKENGHHHVYQAVPNMAMPMSPFFPSNTMAPPPKTLLEAAPIKEQKQAKEHKASRKSKPGESTIPPTPESFPAIIDDGTKPSHSYAQLIGMAILRSSGRRLTLAQIYKWISEHFSFYKPGDAGWQNSIRHNLSLHKAFVKTERPKDDPGKGNYWTIEPGQEGMFLKEKSSKKTGSAGENVPVMSTRLEPSKSTPASVSSAASTSPAISKPRSSSQPELPLPRPSSSQSKLPEAVEPSSEATIPASELGMEDTHIDDVPADQGQDPSLLSPMPPPLMHSSPPMPLNDGTPPHLRAPGGRKRKHGSVDDSGYMSALESSVMRPNQKNMLVASDGERPRKRGSNRAEDEILRISRMRAPSCESPTKGRSRGSGAMLPPSSSSPLCSRSQLMPPPPPLTPATKLQAQLQSTPAESPTTNLRNHRQKINKMLESPYKRVPKILEENHPASPLFSLDYMGTGPGFGIDSPTPDFPIYHDGLALSDDLFALDPAGNGSPVKRPAKRARIERTQSASALADITSAASNRGSLQFDLSNASIGFSPTKVLDFGSSPTKYIQSPASGLSPSKPMLGQQQQQQQQQQPWGQTNRVEDFFAPQAITQTYDMLTGQPFDMLQGFQKIGSNAQHHHQQHHQPNGARPGSKPMLSRSFSSAL